MALKKTDPARKAALQKELDDVQAAIKNLRKDFKDIQKRAKDLTKKVYTNSDDKKVQQIRKKLAL
jgi:predicted  nucleic acid-binding Zn-ribbon protein